MADEKPHIDLPAPTVWPMVTAFGITLMVSGLVTHWTISAVGVVLMLYAAVHWFLQVYPHEKHESVALVPEAERVRDIEVTSRSVGHLELGKGGHRVAFPLEMHPYSSGVYGGLVGGVVMAGLAVLYGIIAKGSIWWPVNVLSATVLPSLANASDATLLAFSLPGLLLGILIHGITSMLIGLLYAAALPMFPKFAWLWAGILTPIFWSALFFSVAPFVSPAMADKVDWPWFIVCQLGFGMVGGFVVARSQKIETVQTYPLAARAGVESKWKTEDDK